VRVFRSLSVLAVLVPGLLTLPVVPASAAPTTRPVAPVVTELRLSGVAGQLAPMSTGRSGARTVLLTGLRSTRPFSVVGVTWAAHPSVGTVRASVRTRTGGRWSGWQSLGGAGDEQPDAGSADARRSRRGGTSPLWVGSADGVQARVDVLGGADPRDLRLSLVDPGTSPADAAHSSAPLSVASAGSALPVIHSRATWGADESLRTAAPSYATGIHAVTVHHTASSNDYSAADVPRLLRGFYAYHVKSNGWSDLGYNFLVDKYGRIWEGRAGGVSRAVMGSHAGGFNTGTVGISLIGTYQTVAPSAAARESVARLAAWRLSAAGKDPASNVRVYSAGSTRFAQGLLVTLPRIFGHRDVSSTSCPGTQGMTALPGIRSRAAALAAGMPPAVARPVPDEAVLPLPAPPAAPAPSAPAPPAPAPPAPAPPAPASPDGISVLAPTSVRTGTTVPLTVAGGAVGAPVEVWFSRRGEHTSSRRRTGHFAGDGTFRTSYLANDVYTVFAVSGARASARVTTSVGALPAMVRASAPRLRVIAPALADAGSSVPVTVTGTPGAPVDLWLRKRRSTGWTRLAIGRLNTAGRWPTSYLGDDDVEYWASSQGLSSPDGGTLVTPVVRGPASAALGARVQLTGRARPGDEVLVESRRRGSAVFTRTALVADSTGAFRTGYAADDEYDYRVVAANRLSALQRTTVAPTALSAPLSRPGTPVVLRGTARPGAEVQVLFSPGAPSVAVAGRRPRAVTPYSVGRVATAGSDGRWSTTWTPRTTSRWYARADGNASPMQSTAVR